jgi:hypothetical protein
MSIVGNAFEYAELVLGIVFTDAALCSLIPPNFSFTILTALACAAVAVA